MSGGDVLQALGYIDEAYITEAESARLSNPKIWLRISSAAACLCLLVGVFYLAQREKMAVEILDGKSEISACGVVEIPDDTAPIGMNQLAEESKEIMEPESEPEPRSYLISAQAIRTDGVSEDISYPFVTVLRSREELEDYCRAQSTLFDLESGFVNVCETYDAQYFAENDLILYVAETGGTVPPRVTDFRLEAGTWVIAVAKDALTQDAGDMTQWHVLIEVQMGKVIEPEDKVTVQPEDKEN